MDATTEIQQSLKSETNSRRRRSVVVLASLVALALVFPALTGFRSMSPRTIGFVSVSLLLVLAAGASTFDSRIHLRSAVVRSIVLFTVLVPLSAAEMWSDASVPYLPEAIGCFVSIAVTGLLALLFIRTLFGRIRRRFGGARILQGGTAAVIGAVAVGLHCPLEDALHLASHVAAATVVSLLLSRLVLSE